MPLLCCVIGPTAAGKSALVEALCPRIPYTSIIINGDSQQVYKEFPTLTDQPLPHAQKKLYGHISAAHDPHYSAHQWCQQVVKYLQTLPSSTVVWIVGGTGFYFDTLYRGLSPLPSLDLQEKQAFLNAHQAKSTADLYSWLTQADPISAHRMVPQDRHRILHALWILHATRTPLSTWHSMPRKPYLHHPFTTLYVQPNTLLHQSIAHRIHRTKHAMYDEVVHYLTHNPVTSAAQRILGFTLWSQVHAGHLSFAAATEQLFFRTCQYAKRQRTWWRSRPLPSTKYVTLETPYQDILQHIFSLHSGKPEVPHNA